MEIANDPKTWTEKEWLSFLLLAAIDADGKRHPREMRYLQHQVGEEALEAVSVWMKTLDEAEKTRLLRESLPIFVKGQSDRERLQKMLRDVFLADGEYGAEEQAVTKKIGDWLRGNV